MKFYSALITAAVLFVSAVSCRKEKNDIPDQPAFNAKLLIKTDMDEEGVTISYNPDRTVKQFITPQGQGTESIATFTYNGNIVTQTEHYNGVKLNEHVLKLANGRLIKSTYNGFDALGNISYTSFIDYAYNGKGQLIKEESSEGYSKEYIYDVNGNLAESREYTGVVYKRHKQYEYYIDKEEKPMSFNIMETRGWGGFKGMFSKNVLKKIIIVDVVAQTTEAEFNYTYEFDADGYVIKGKMTEAVNNYGREWTNVYQ